MGSTKGGVVHTAGGRMMWCLALIAVLFPQTSGSAAAAQFHDDCLFSHTLPDDPIVKPGVPGASHQHEFFANTTTHAASTYESMIQGSTTCPESSGDTAAYWVPTLLRNGIRLAPWRLTAYYRKLALNHNAPVVPPPPDFRMIVGTATAKTWADNRDLGSHILFKCSDDTNVGAVPPTACASGGLALTITFPNCWDGVHTDSTNHKSHMAFSSRGSCPLLYDVPIPQIVMRLTYKTGTQVGDISFSSGAYWTIHADFWNTWQQTSLIQMISTCLNSQIACARAE